MITRRDIAVAAVAILLTFFVISHAQQKQALPESSIFDWNSIPPKPTESGSVRLFFKGPTATLDSLDIHVTTLDPGKAPHPPHKHLNEELVIIKEGMLEVLQNGERKRAGPGSVAIHSKRVARSEPARRYESCEVRIPSANPSCRI